MKSGSTLVPTWQGEGQSKQHPRKPGRNHLQRSRRNVVITAHIDGCRHVLPSVHEVGRTLFFKQEILIDPFAFEYGVLLPKKASGQSQAREEQPL